MGDTSEQVWYAIPCANYEMARRTLPIWRERGYKIALLTDRDRPVPDDVHKLADVIATPWSIFKGYAQAVNYLVAHVIPASVPVVVTGGDDMYPDRRYRADEILIEFRRVFADLFGVMQPIGDTLEGTDRICGSPWMGRRFIEEVNQGNGPYWRDYFAFYSDEELFNVTKLLGCLWQAPEYTHYHDHWTRKGESRPSHLDQAHANWDKDKALFESRKRMRFPGHARLVKSQKEQE